MRKITLSALDIYRQCLGDIDGLAYSRTPREIITEDEFERIGELLHKLAIAASGRASAAFISKLENDLSEATVDNQTRQLMRDMAGNTRN